MVDALVFSKNRAAQLDLLLRSITEHAAGLYSSVTVLWAFSADRYEWAYRTCIREHPEASFEREWSFGPQVRAWLARASRLVSFLVDDDVFYRDAPSVDEDLRSLSLRGGDYSYPFSLDGNIYRRTDIAYLLHELHFTDPTELEHAGHTHRHRLPFSEVRPCVPPCLVGVPANRVSVSSGMPHMGVRAAVLNDAYLDGARLGVEPVHHDLPAHAPLSYREHVT